MDHENSHILKKAIDEMPTHVAPERVWAGIQSEIVPEQNRVALEKALADYKKPVVSPVSWEKLASRFEDDLLPREEGANSPIKVFSLSNARYWLSGIAAAAIMGVCIGVYINTRYEVQGTGFEVRDTDPATDDVPGGLAEARSPEATEEEALKFIDRFCGDENVICTSEAFLELKAELDESTEELKEISKQLSVFRNDPGLLQAKSTIEKYRATVLKEITLMI